MRKIRPTARLTSLTIAFAFAAVTLVTGAGSASAATTRVAASVGMSLDCEGQQCIQATAYLVNADGIAQFMCAMTAPGASAVTVTSCTVGDLAAPRLSVAGGAVATVGTGTANTSQRLLVCWAGNATSPVNGLVVATQGCSHMNPGLDLPEPVHN